MYTSGGHGMLLLWFLLYSNLHCFVALGRRQLLIGGMFPMGPNSAGINGSDVVSACELAIEMVNNRTDMLPNYKLNLLYNNTKCNEGTGTRILLEYLLKRPAIIMLIGAGCSSVSRAVSQTAWQWNIVQVSYASTASELSNKNQYPLFYRVLPPDSTRIAALIRFLKFYKWNRIAILGENGKQFDEVMLELNQELLRQNFTVITSLRFTENPERCVKNLKEKDARIIVALLHQGVARRVFCQAYKVGMYSSKYVWLDLYGNPEWWLNGDIHKDCTNEQWSNAVSGHFFFDSVGPLTDSKKGVSRKTSQEVIDILSKGKDVTENFSLFAFDAVWVVALTLHKAAQQLTRYNKTLDAFNYKDQEIAATIKTSLQELSFDGVTGRIQFDKHGDRIAPVRIVQFQNGVPTTVASYDSVIAKLSHNSSAIWQGSPPLDGQRFIHEVVHVLWPLFWCLIGLTSCGIILALIFLIFNVVYRSHSFIMLSSPNINNVMLVGAIFIYSSVFLILLDSRVVQPSTLPYLCSVTGFILGIGYSMFVGAILSKTWRIYQILHNVYSKRKVFKDSQLCGIVVLFVVVDILMFTMMSTLDPFTLGLRTVGQSNQSAITDVYQYEYCNAKHITTWLYVILGYKALMLLIGCFIAMVTRKVKARALNDSRFIGASMFVIMVAAIIGTPLTFSMVERNAVVAVSCFSLILPTTISLCLVFIPKISTIRKNSEDLLQLNSLSAMRSDNDFNNQSWPRVKKELRERKAYNASVQAKESDRCDEAVDGSIPNSSRKHFTARSNTCHNLTYNPKLQPANQHRRYNTISVPSVLGNYSSRPIEVEEDPQKELKVENASLRRKLRQTKICEAGKMCKVLYENAELNRKIVELSMSTTKDSDADTVSRLIKENNELKQQLGEVSILNSVGCDTTPRMKRKEIQHNNNASKGNLRELQHLLTVDLGGGRASSFGASRSKRPPTIGLSQSSLNLFDPNHHEVVGESEDNKQADNGGISVHEREETNTSQEKNDEEDIPSDVCPKRETTVEKELPQSDTAQDPGDSNQSHQVASREALAGQQDNKGFQDDQEHGQTKKTADKEEKDSETSHDPICESKSEPSTKDKKSEYETSKTKELLKKGTASITPSFDLSTYKKERYDKNEPTREAEQWPTCDRSSSPEQLPSMRPSTPSYSKFRKVIGGDTSKASDMLSSQYLSMEAVESTEEETGGEHCLINRKRMKSKNDRKTKIEKVEKTFFV